MRATGGANGAPIGWERPPNNAAVHQSWIAGVNMTEWKADQCIGRLGATRAAHDGPTMVAREHFDRGASLGRKRGLRSIDITYRISVIMAYRRSAWPMGRAESIPPSQATPHLRIERLQETCTPPLEQRGPVAAVG